ncbi:hypothetical protein KFL_000460355 [Klebsormidium nitens]|uniref:MYND-type domain-containing protein n=1 Tax=Klebsormidium nitens TaxID=105231 RepID=A0A1Y1HNA7_KLENI|nr:hypothetical protein KFL_000460355 [Klebsormidium nitens]|eukprot:GAQ80125.1 hypothetical protein KFL_000460355 [Klebsormidium nitens]
MKLALKGDAIEQRFKDRIKAGSRQNVKQPAEIRAYLEKSAQGILEIDRQIQDPKTEKKRSKKLRAGFLRNIREKMCLSDDAKDLSAKFLAARANGRIDAPVVCSWDLCDAGTALDAGKPYRKCANCSLAIYCNKEHQKMHWKTHKKHCKQAKNRGESDLVVAPTKTAAANERTAYSQRQRPAAAADASSPRFLEAAVRTRVQQTLNSASITDDDRLNTHAPEVLSAED